jgi:hypothetical protein
MPKNDIGGFFVSLGLAIDKPSFETGNKLIDNVGNSFNKLIGAARNASVVLVGTAVATGAVESNAYKTAEAIGITTESLDLWKASAKIAGIDSNSLISAMSRMADVMNHMTIDGSGLESFTKELGKLGIISDDVDMEKLLNMAPDKLMTEIIRKAQETSAQAKKDIAEAQKALAINPNDTAAQAKLENAEDAKRQVQTIVGDILGDEGKKFYIEIERQGKTIDEFLTGAQKTVFTTAEDNEKGNNFRVETDTLKTELESITKLLGDSVAGELTPYLKDWNKWIQENRDDIREAVQAVAIVLGKVAGYVQESTKRLLMDENQTSDANTLNAVLERKRSFNFKENGVFKGLKEGLVGDADYKLLSDMEKNQVANYYKKYGNLTGLNLKNVDLLDVVKRTQEESPKQNSGTKTNQGTKTKTSQKNKNWWEESEAQYDQSVHDGIIRPDGTVTQVAPDDWVLAARDLGDLSQAFAPKEPNIAPDTLSVLANTVAQMARSFIPQQNNTAIQQASEYTINQTFNVSGGNDMPQVLRQQAYRGTQEGLLEVMQQSSRRLQLMSGMR